MIKKAQNDKSVTRLIIIIKKIKNNKWETLVGGILNIIREIYYIIHVL